MDSFGLKLNACQNLLEYFVILQMERAISIFTKEISLKR